MNFSRNQLIGGLILLISDLDGDSLPHAILCRVNAGSNFNPIIAIVGPTASGKSTLGIEVALELNGEIINCDSVQVYQGIEIATAKVPIEERRGVPHHLIDFVPPHINYTAGEWAREARCDDRRHRATRSHSNSGGRYRIVLARSAHSFLLQSANGC